MTFITKDSGQRQDYASGMRRDTQEGKPDFYLCMPQGVPYSEQMLTRWAALMSRGMDKYGYRNWEKANSEEELNRFKSSAMRHFMQWLCGETDEDHAAAVFFNITAAEYVKGRVFTISRTREFPSLEQYLAEQGDNLTTGNSHTEIIRDLVDEDES